MEKRKEKNKLTEDEKKLVFYGFHSAKNDLKNGFYKGDISTMYPDAIKETYQNYISEYDENLENDDIDEMAEILEKKGFGFTFVSREPIKASAFQSGRYKYGEFLYKIYGKGGELVLDDYNEINAEIIVSKNPLYFEKVEEVENITESNKIKGGKADNKSSKDIANKFSISVNKVEKQIKKGKKVESEHTKDEDKIEEISMDHLFEFPDYYDRLEKMEKEAKKYWKNKTNENKLIIKKLLRENLI